MKGIDQISGLIVGISLLFVSNASTAQDWSAEEKEVLDRVEECIGFFNNDAYAGVMDCIRDDFSGWLYGDPVVRGKNNFATIGKFYMENSAVSAMEFRPLDVTVLGDVAVVHYYTYTIYAGSMDITRDRWTDILVKDDGTWRWVADHGGTDPASTNSDDD